MNVHLGMFERQMTVKSFFYRREVTSLQSVLVDPGQSQALQGAGLGKLALLA
jgi:hypothetical protein